MSVREVVIDVTEEDNREGKPGSCGACPIALASKRAFPDADKVHVDTQYIEIIKDGRIIATAELPDEAVAFIEEFDSSIPVKPIRFTLKFTATTEEHQCS